MRVEQPIHRPPQEALDENTVRHLTGGCGRGYGWAWCWICTYGLLVFSFVSAFDDHLVMLVTWVCTVATSLAVPAVTYRCLGKPQDVQLGLLVNFFWWGGLAGCYAAIIGETFMNGLWRDMSPNCQISDPATEHASDPGCSLVQLFQWILTPGLWEELFKGIWVLARFKLDPQWTDERCINAQTSTSVPRTTCVCLPTNICTWWWRLAISPYAVLLSAMAAGGGFESIENIGYMVMPMAKASQAHQDMGLGTVIFRACLFTHVLWTGMVGIRIAQRKFKPPGERPSLLLTFLPSMVLHGIWDWAAFNAVYLGGGTTVLILLTNFIVSLVLFIVPIRRGALRDLERPGQALTAATYA